MGGYSEYSRAMDLAVQSVGVHSRDMRTALFLTTIAVVTWFAARKSPVTRLHSGQLVILLGLLTAAAALLGSVARSFQRDATSSFEFMAGLPTRFLRLETLHSRRGGMTTVCQWPSRSFAPLSPLSSSRSHGDTSEAVDLVADDRSRRTGSVSADGYDSGRESRVAGGDTDNRIRHIREDSGGPLMSRQRHGLSAAVLIVSLCACHSTTAADASASVAGRWLLTAPTLSGGGPIDCALSRMTADLTQRGSSVSGNYRDAIMTRGSGFAVSDTLSGVITNGTVSGGHVTFSFDGPGFDFDGIGEPVRCRAR